MAVAACFGWSKHTIHKCRRALVSPPTVARAQLWLPPRRLFSAAHAGCVERAACMCTACALHTYALHVHCMCTAYARHTHGMRTAWGRHAHNCVRVHCVCTAHALHCACTRCIEGAFGRAGSPCEFDGRFSLVHLHGEWLLYARANIAAGTRFVQLTRSRDLRVWAPFELIRLAGWPAHEAAAGSGTAGGEEPINIYYWGVSLNPVRAARHTLICTASQRVLPSTLCATGRARSPAPPAPVNIRCATLHAMHRMHAACALHAAREQVREGSLLALFPMVHLGQGCVALSCSADGVRWARPTPLLACDTDIPPVHTIMQPAIGVLRRGELVDFYVHRDVAEVATTEELHPFPQATLVRYSLSAHTLTDWTAKQPEC